MIRVEAVTKRYGAYTAVDDVTFTADPGRVTGFLGPNGAGKSTTMRIIVGLTPPTTGAVHVLGRRFTDLPNPRPGRRGPARTSGQTRGSRSSTLASNTVSRSGCRSPAPPGAAARMPTTTRTTFARSAGSLVPAPIPVASTRIGGPGPHVSARLRTRASPVGVASSPVPPARTSLPTGTQFEHGRYGYGNVTMSGADPP